MPVIDLHVHSSCSDGMHTPSEVIAIALERHVRVLSITDLNSVDSYFALKELHEQSQFPDDILFLPGLEVSAVSEVDRSEQRLCVYFPFLAIANKFPFELKFESTVLRIHQPEEN